MRDSYNLDSHSEYLLKSSVNTIRDLKKEVYRLQSEILELSKENQELLNYRANYHALEIKAQNLTEHIKKLQSEKQDAIKGKDEEISELNTKILELESKIELNKLDYDQNTEMYKQKMSIYNQILLENEVYSEELKHLKKSGELFELQKKEEFRKQKVNHLFKYEKLKNKMIDTIKQSNKESSKLKSEYSKVNNNVTMLQNKQFLLQIDFQKNKIKNLENKNKELLQKIAILENDVYTHKNIEKNLLNKIENENNKTNGISRNANIKFSKSSNLFYKKKQKFTINSTKNIQNKQNILIDDNDSINDYKNQTNKKIQKNNSAIGFISKPSIFEKRNLSYKNEILKKNYENEKMKLINSKLKNKINLYSDKYNGLFIFLEECLNNFFNDKEIVKNKKFHMKLDDIKNMDFNDFNADEKYALLVLLMKNLLPLVSVGLNFKDNIGKDLFKTNLNLINNNYNKNKVFLQDKFLKNAFQDNYKYHNDLHADKTMNINSSVPVLRELKDIELNYFNDKNRAIFI